MTENYTAGVCNIGPQEIQARRRFGHLGLAVSVVVGALMLVTDAPHLLRLLILFPAAGAAMGYLQAAFRFCAGFGMRGVYNFGRLGSVHVVADAQEHQRDRRRSLQITGVSLLIGCAAALLLYRV